MPEEIKKRKRISYIFYGSLTISLLLNTILIPISISNQSGHNLDNNSIPLICNLTYKINPVNATCTKNQSQIRSYIGDDFWVHKCDNGIYDIRLFLSGKETRKGINLNTIQWNNLKRLNI